MSEHIERASWSGYFKGYNQRNEARLTRLQIFGELGAQEAGHNLPFSGITFEDGTQDASKLQIMLGNGTPSEMSHLTHTILRAKRITPKESADGSDEALEIEDDLGVITLLSFTEQTAFLPAT